MTKEELITHIKNRYSECSKRSQGLSYGSFYDGYMECYAELEYQLTHRNCLDCSNHSSKLRMRTLELEKENAELKKQLEMSNKVYNDNLDYSYHIEEQLTKAKEIIKEFMKYEITEYDGSLEIHFEELKKQAEQFLSEVEKCM